MKDTGGGLSTLADSSIVAAGGRDGGARRRENLKLQVNSMPAVVAQRVNGTSSSSTTTISRTVKPPAPARPSVGQAARDGTKPVKKRICASCATQLGRFFNTGSPCPSCGQKTCSNCRVRMYRPDRKKTWLCTFCVKERQSPIKNQNDRMQRRNSVLRRNPLPLMIANEALLTLPRNGGMHSTHAPVSNRISYNGSLPRNFTALSDPPQLTMGEYYTATRGRPVATPGTPGAKKRAPPIPKKPERVFQVVTAPLSDLEKGKHQSATLGRPVKDLISPMAARRWEETAEVVTTLRRAKPSAPVFKEKYIHVETISSSVNESRSSVAFSPQSTRKEGGRLDSRLLNGIGGGVNQLSPPVKSATLDHRNLRRHTTSSFGELTQPNSAAPTPGTPYEASPSLESSNLSATTLPRILKKVQRGESLTAPHSTYIGSKNADQSLSLLNLTHTSGSPSGELLTKPQPGIGHNVGLRHPSYATFSRSDSRRKSFMERGASLRRSSSFKLDEQLYKTIWNEIALDYDDFLTVVKTNLKNVAEYYLDRGTPEMVRKFSIRRKPMPALVTGVPFPVPRRSSIPNLTQFLPLEVEANPYDALLTMGLASPTSPVVPLPTYDEPSWARQITPELVRHPSLTSSVQSRSSSGKVSMQENEPQLSPSRKSSFSGSLTSDGEATISIRSWGSPRANRHVSVIEIKPPSSSTAADSVTSSSKNVFEVTEMAPDVEIVFQEMPKTRTSFRQSDTDLQDRDRGLTRESQPINLETYPASTTVKDMAPSVVRIDTFGDNSLGQPSDNQGTNNANHSASPVIPSTQISLTASEAEGAFVRRGISPPVAFVKSPEVKPRKSLTNQTENTVSVVAPPEGTLKEAVLPPAGGMFSAHVQNAHSEIASILSGVPKLKPTPKLPPVVPLDRKAKEDGIAEFQRVLGNLREAKKPADMVAPLRAAPVVERHEEETGSEVQRVSAAIQHFKKVNEEVQDLKDFLKSVRQGKKNIEDDVGNRQSTDASSSALSAQLPTTSHLTGTSAAPAKSALFANETDSGIHDSSREPSVTTDSTQDEPSSTLSSPELPEEVLSYQRSSSTVDISPPAPAVLTNVNHVQPVYPPSSLHITHVEHTAVEPPFAVHTTINDARRPERAKWHSSLLDSHSNGSLETNHVFPDHLEEAVSSPTEDIHPDIPVKKCVPAAGRSVLFSHSSSDSEEERAEFDFEDESDNSAFSDDGTPAMPTIKACRKVDLAEDDLDPSDAVEMWEVEPQPIPLDYFGRLQVPLDPIQEESEDEDRESEFTRTINRFKAMRPVVSSNLNSPDEEGENQDPNTWQVGGNEEEDGDDGQSNLEQYFITGLLQPSAAGNKPYFRNDMDFDALEEGEVVARKAEPSIFGSAKLKFGSSDYRLSSDMDDLSVSSPSDDESFY